MYTALEPINDQPKSSQHSSDPKNPIYLREFGMKSGIGVSNEKQLLVEPVSQSDNVYSDTPTTEVIPMHNHSSGTNQVTSAPDDPGDVDKVAVGVAEVSARGKKTPIEKTQRHAFAEGSVGGPKSLTSRELDSVLFNTVDSEMGESTGIRVRRPKRRWRLTRCEGVLLTIIGLLVAILLLLLFSAFRKPPTAEVCQTVECIATSQKILSGMNFSVDPCNDFYSYACGNWIENHHIPPGTNSWTVFSELAQTAEFFAKELLEDTSTANDSRGLELAQIYYASCTNEHEIDRLGLKPLQDVLIRMFEGWRLLPPGTPGSRSDLEDPFTPAKFDLTDLIGRFLQFGHGIDIFQLLVERDPKNSSRFSITLAPGVVSMQPEYYLETSDLKIIRIVQYFKDFMRNYSLMLGVDESQLGALERVFELETQIAKSMEPRARQSIETNYVKLNLTELAELCPVIQWERLLTNLFKDVSYTVRETETVIIGDRSFFEKRCKIYEEYLKSADTIKILHDAAVWRILWSTSPYMPTRVRKKFEIYEQANTGVREQPQRWLTCVRSTEEFFGMTIARKFVAAHFDVTSKEKATEMIMRIKMAFKSSFYQVEWMDAEAKKGAEEKVDMMGDSIGYPEDITDIEKENRPFVAVTSLSPDTFLDNSLTLARSKTLVLLQKLFNDSLKTWEMAPHVVNAFYNPRENHIYFPAGILQKPFYDTYYPLALNYGGIGVVVGHEIVHAFDRQGSKYDAKGNLRQWWSESTRTDFEKNSECMIHQYGNYTVQGKNVDGQLTLSENIADNGGLKAAYRAFKRLQSLQETPRQLPGLNLTMDQLFFISFAQVWCKRQLPQAALHTVMFDVHSPERYRVIGTLSNSEDFASTFMCPRGSYMNPEHKCVLW
nr:unnamed protein product [Spirometra erinaceieuropaei]